jgi:RimJ/RimL family protein N-acetyltransferase
MDFDRQPTLQGSTLELRPLRAADRGAFVAVANDPLIWEEHPESDRATPAKVERFFADALASGGALVVTTAAGEIIGGSRFEEPDAARSRVLVDHTFLARTHWDRESYTEVKGLMFDHAFRTVETVELQIGADNARTREAVEEFLGAVHVDTVPTPLGDHAVYEISREAWRRRG